MPKTYLTRHMEAARAMPHGDRALAEGEQFECSETDAEYYLRHKFARDRPAPEPAAAAPAARPQASRATRAAAEPTPAPTPAPADPPPADPPAPAVRRMFGRQVGGG